jgi:manganese/zinc/iron transport system permease protein
MSLLGDAISHAVLPGIVVAVLITGKLTGWPIFIGAMVVGVLTSFLAQGITRLGRVSEDTSLGIVFTSLFALGVVLIQAYARHADSTSNASFGQIDTPASPTILQLAISGRSPTLSPRWSMSPCSGRNSSSSFDPALAAAMGLSVPVIHYSLMAMVAGVSVTSFDAVGSILVVAMLIVPGPPRFWSPTALPDARVGGRSASFCRVRLRVGRAWDQSPA